MRKKITAWLLFLLLLTGIILPVSAQELPSIADETGLLQEDEIHQLEEIAHAITNQYHIQTVILIVDSLNGKNAQDFADDYYDNAGYGDDGVLFLMSMSEREWYISTCGTMIYALTDYGIQNLGDLAVSYFAEGMWYDGFYHYLSELPVYLDAYENGSPIDGYADYSGDYYHGDQEEVVYYEEEYTPSFGLSLLCGIAAAGITILVMRASMNTKRAQRDAGAYMTDGSWNLSQHRDVFLYSNVTKSRKQESSSGSSGGGSSVHRSSGGRRHGGGGGKF